MAVGVNIVSTFDSKGINRAIKDFQKLEGTGNKATFGLRTVDKAFTNGAKNIAKYGGLLAAGLGIAATQMVKGAELAKQADDRLLAVSRSMGIFGAQSDVVAQRLMKLADAQEYELGVTAETIKLTQAKLLTFKELAVTADVVGGAFDRATTAAVDLAAAGFGEASQNATQLGKALNDPIKGITALARSGVTFTAQEKEKIKALVESGKMLEAQDTLLKAIETQVGGTAASTVTATFKIGAAFGHVRDVVGTLLLPLFEKFADFMVNKVVPYATKVEQAFGEKGVAGGLKLLATDFLNVTTNMGAFGNAMLVLVSVFTAVKLTAIAATIATKLFGVALLANPIGIFIASVIAFGVALAALYLKFESVRKVVNMLGEVLKFVVMNAIAGVVNYFVTFINIAITGINLLIKAANFFGADIEEIGTLGKMAFTGIGDAADTAKKKIGGVAEVAGAMAAKEGGVQNVAKALKAVANAANGGGGGGGGGAAKAVETAQQKLQKYIDALKGMSSAQKSARDADKSLMKSRTSLAEATTKLTDAQAYFNQVVAGYGADSKQAKDRQVALRKAQAAVERAGYDVESSVFAVANAEQELADLRKDPETSAQAIREAEISLAEAKLSVKDATDAQVEATDALTEAETLLDEAINGAKEGSDAYTDALDRLNDAKKAQVDATDAVTDAIERQTEAVEKLREAEAKAQEARTGVKAGDATAAEAKVGVAPAPLATAGGFGSFMEAVRGLHPNSSALKSGTPVTDARKQFPKLYNEYKAKGLAMAQGGIITKPTQVLAGENGKEAIIPLDRLQSGMTINLTINAGMGTDPAKLGDEIVDVLTRYQRRNGALPLKVA
jgi:hypothetical protein